MLPVLERQLAGERGGHCEPVTEAGQLISLLPARGLQASAVCVPHAFGAECGAAAET